MTYKRYTSYPTFTLDPTKGTLVSALTNGRYEELRFSDDGEVVRWMSDRTVFSPEVKSYGGSFPFYNNELTEYGSLFCRYQDDFDSVAGRLRTFTPINIEGGSVSLSKIAPLYDLSSLYLSAVDNDGGAIAGLSYNANTPNDWTGVDARDMSIDFYVKPHGVEADGASLTIAFEQSSLGVRIARAGGIWNAILLVDGVEVAITPVTLPLDQWSYVVLNKSSSSAVTIAVNGSSVYSNTVTPPVTTTFTSFDVRATGLTMSGTSFFVSNLRLDVNALRKTLASTLFSDDSNLGLHTAFYFPFDTSTSDPFYDKVTCLLRSDYSVTTSAVTAESEPNTVPFYDVVGYNRAIWQPNGFATLFAITQAEASSQFARDPAVQRTQTLAGVVSNQSAGVTGKGYPFTSFVGAYLPWIRISERDHYSLTFGGDFTFELWCYMAKPGCYVFTTGSGIALVDGALTGIGSSISLNGFGVTTGISRWNHIAIARSGSTVRVFINQELAGTGSHSGTVSFNDLDLFGANGSTTAGFKYLQGVYGQIRATKACRYTTGSDVTAQVYNTFTRLEYPRDVHAAYDSKTDFIYGLVPWQTFGLDGGNLEVVRLTLYKFDPRARELVTTRDIWVKSNGYEYPSNFTYFYGNIQEQIAGRELRLVGNSIVLPSRNHEYVFFSKTDLSTEGKYAAFVNNDRQQQALIEAGPDRYLTWLATSIYGGSITSTAFADANSGNLVAGLHFADRPYHHLFRDSRDNVVTITGGVHDNNVATSGFAPHIAFFDSSRTGLITIQSNPDFAYQGDFTIELEVKFYETSAGNITACKLYEQNGIEISASGLTLTASVFGDTLQFVGTGSGSTATFGAVAASSATTTAKIHHIALTRTSGVVRLFKDGVMAQKVTNTTVNSASDIVLGRTLYGYLDEVFVYNGVSKYNSDATFTPIRYTATVNIYGQPITHRAAGIGNYQKYVLADGVYTSTVHTLATARRSRKTSTGNIVFDRELVSPALPLTTSNVINEAGIAYHPGTDQVWVFPSQEPLNGTGNVGYIWDLASNAVTPIPKQGNMLRTISTNGAFVYRFNTVSASNTLADFGEAVNHGLTIDQDEAWSTFHGSLVMNKVPGAFARMAFLPVTSVFATANTSFTTGNWTIELRYLNTVLQAETSRDVLVTDQYAHAPRFEIGVDRTATDCCTFFRVFNGIQVIDLTSLGAPEQDVGVGTWAHIALVRNGGSILGYTNGVLTHSYTLPNASLDMVGSFSNGFIGCSSEETNFARGRIQEIAVGNGLARYTGATYTVPAEPFIRRAGSAESIWPLKTYVVDNDVIYCARMGQFGSSTYCGAWRFNSSGVLQATYGFVGFDDNVVVGVFPQNGAAQSLWLGPRMDGGSGDYTLYGYGTSQQPYLYAWELDQPSIWPTRRMRFIMEAWPTSTDAAVAINFPLSNLLVANAFARNIPNRLSTAEKRVVALSFEDIVTGPPISTADVYPDVALTTQYADMDITFTVGAVATRSQTYGGYGVFSGVRTPTAARGGESAMALTASPVVISSSATTAFADGVSLWQTSSQAFTIELYSGVDATGSLVGTTTSSVSGSSWTHMTVAANAAFRSIRISGTAGTFYIDNLTLGSLTASDAGLMIVNGSNVTPALPAAPTPDVILPVPMKNGIITGDMTAPTTAPVTHTGLPLHTDPVINESTVWHRITHDGTKTLKITLMQPSSFTQSALQRHNVDRYLSISLYDSLGRLVQRPYTNEHMLSYVGSLNIPTESSISKPYHVPLVIPKGFPADNYYIGTVNRIPSGLREYSFNGNGVNLYAGNSTGFVGFGDTQSAASDMGRFITAELPQLSISCEALPLTDSVNNTAITIQGDVESTLTINTASPLAGTGSVEFNLSAVGSSQETIIYDSLWSNTLLLTKLEGSYDDISQTPKTVLSTSGSYTTARQYVRFGDYSVFDGEATWSYTYADLPLPDRNGLTVDMYVKPSPSETASLSVTFSKNTNTQSFLIQVFRDATTAGKYKLRARCFDSEVFGGVVFDTSSTAFDFPTNDRHFHLTLQKDAPASDVSTLKCCVNGVVVGSLNLNVAVGYVTGSNQVTLASSGFGYLNEFRVTAASRYSMTPFAAPHYTFPSLPTPAP